MSKNGQFQNQFFHQILQFMHDKNTLQPNERHQLEQILTKAWFKQYLISVLVLKSITTAFIDVTTSTGLLHYELCQPKYMYLLKEW